ncbi:MAG: deoxyribodipyrimidine photo-lyase [Chloroflexi bacterium]|nr:deoxyribodipyrimidine photo-lyase [Chloroflexota bacterium]
MRTAIWWVRRDLRLADNQALTVALNQAEQVLPVLDPALQAYRTPSHLVSRRRPVRRQSAMRR